MAREQDDLLRRGIGMTSQRTRERLIQRLYEEGLSNAQVLEVIRRTPRHLFVDEALAHRAYDDSALPLGYAQTISQPYVVARMIELLAAGRELGKTLEVGTGCGYQAAVLAGVAREVFSVERIKTLLDRAKENLRLLRLPNLRLKYADGSVGLPEAAPFDSIILAAAASAVPKALLTQLAPNGRMILPLGVFDQVLLLIERTPGGGFKETRYDLVRFVPLLTGIE